ncbi:MAG TPA: taurine dioxygenase [Dongiaceae bacterium]|jgi:taurine dioxygenase
MSTTALARKPSASNARKLDVAPLNPTFVAEVHDFDLAKPHADETIAAVREALIKHKLLLFRDQSLTPSEQKSFAVRFGNLHIHPLLNNDDNNENPEIIVLNYDRETPPEPDLWHTDVTFIATPPLGSILYGVAIPETGGDTLFADLGAAYKGLSEPLKQALASLTARHDFTRSFRVSKYYGPDNDPEKWERARKNNPPVSHPVVRTHPETGEKGLFVNRGFTEEIEGLSHLESDALLELLFRHIEQPQFGYRHRWQAGDVLFWDNRITSHMVVADYWPQHRRMHRATILGDRPV